MANCKIVGHTVISRKKKKKINSGVHHPALTLNMGKLPPDTKDHSRLTSSTTLVVRIFINRLISQYHDSAEFDTQQLTSPGKGVVPNGPHFFLGGHHPVANPLQHVLPIVLSSQIP